MQDSAVRSCQHVQFPEVRELQDRLGILSEQENGSRYPKLRGAIRLPQMVECAKTLARVCYNNPGVVLLSHANETHFDPTPMLEATLAVDPDRIVVPISGNYLGGPVRPPKGRTRYPKLSDELWAHTVDDFHPYWGWYAWNAKSGEWCRLMPEDRMAMAGEYGAEALDAYETMSKHYPAHWKPTPAKTDDLLWGSVQTKKADAKQVVGFRGKKPASLGQYIEASQTYQSDVLSEVTKGFRLSPQRINGYFQFHFVDVLAANWPKSIVSHDLTPKKGYYAMAQVNQPLVPLPRIADRGKTLELWVANDTERQVENATMFWTIAQGGDGRNSAC